MEDERVWTVERKLWSESSDFYRDNVDHACLMVLPEKPFVLTGEQAIEAVAKTPRWSEVEFFDTAITRPRDGMIVAAYHARAEGPGPKVYRAWCSTTYARRGDGDGGWRVVQHHQTPLEIE